LPRAAQHEFKNLLKIRIKRETLRGPAEPEAGTSVMVSPPPFFWIEPVYALLSSKTMTGGIIR